MIQSKQDYLAYLEADRIQLNKKKWNLQARLFDEVWCLERLLRKVEYYHNCKRTFILSRFYYYLLRILYNRRCAKLGSVVPINVFGPGLAINHLPIIIHQDVRIGANCRMSAFVTIGAGREKKVPVIGDNVFVGPGAVILGGVTIADDSAIGANAVVVKSILEAGTTVGGVPARKIGGMSWCVEDIHWFADHANQ